MIFLYKQVLGLGFEWLSDVERAKKPERLPVVLTRSEVARVLAELHGTCGFRVHVNAQIVAM